MSKDTRATGTPQLRVLPIPWQALDQARTDSEVAAVVTIWTWHAAGSRRIDPANVAALHGWPTHAAATFMFRLMDAGLMDCVGDGRELYFWVTV